MLGPHDTAELLLERRQLRAGIAVGQAVAQRGEFDALAEEGRDAVGRVGVGREVAHDLAVALDGQLAVDDGVEVVLADIGAQIHPVHGYLTTRSLETAPWLIS